MGKNQKCGQKQFYNDTNKHMTESEMWSNANYLRLGNCNNQITWMTLLISKTTINNTLIYKNVRLNLYENVDIYFNAHDTFLE